MNSCIKHTWENVTKVKNGINIKLKKTKTKTENRITAEKKINN